MSVSSLGGYPYSSHGSGEATLAVGSSQKVGDLIYLSVQIDTSNPGAGLGAGGVVAGISDSAGQVATWAPLCYYGDPTLSSYIEIWVGQVVANPSVSTTLTVSYTAPVTSTVDLVALGLTSDAGSFTSWSFVGYATKSNAASTTVSWASITSGTASEQAYLGTSWVGAAYGGSPSSGFTGYSTSSGNAAVYDLALAKSTGYAPTCAQNAALTSSTIGVILSATRVDVAPVRVTQAVQRASFR